MTRGLKNDYNCWLNQYVWTDDNFQELRRDVLPEFAESLTKFMNGKGYVMDSDWYIHKVRIISNWLYAIHVKVVTGRTRETPLQYPPIQHRNTREDIDQFHHVISSEDYEMFLGSWGLHEDFDLESPVGQRTLLELPQLLWRYVDLENSSQGRLVASFWCDSDSDDERFAHRGVDVYIEEARQGFHGGRGAKV
jgi:hypothetical protein